MKNTKKVKAGAKNVRLVSDLTIETRRKFEKRREKIIYFKQRITKITK